MDSNDNLNDQSYIRNFCIIAHIDHGKSTLADRLLEVTGTVAAREMQAQLLDSNPIERERGITIKLAPVRMKYHYSPQNNRQGTTQTQNVSTYILNLIDTPGHVDFSYEVSRSLQACEGAVLVVDATQGVQAQTLANLNLARRQNLRIIPVLNKIDLPNAQIAESTDQLVALGFSRDEILHISAKTGLGVDKLLTHIVELIPAPQGDLHAPLRALIFSSQYDSHKGVVVYVRVVDGMIGDAKKAIHEQKLKFMFSGTEVSPIEVGYFNPVMRQTPFLYCGEVGYIATGLKDVALAKVGDTITIGENSKKDVIARSEATKQSPEGIAASVTSFPPRNDVVPLPGYKEPKPMVFLGLFPINSDEYPQVREALYKLRLSDSAFTFRPISSLALGNGFHCGFLGLLHAEVVQERLSREFNLSLFATAPSVEYKIKVNSHKLDIKADAEGFITIQSASEYPDPSMIVEVREPLMTVTVFSPKRYVGDIMQLCQDKRAEFMDLEYIGTQVDDAHSLAKFTYIMPLSEMIVDFFDLLKGATQGYASLDYDFFDYSAVEAVKLDIMINHEKVDAFSQLVVAARAQYLGRIIVEKLAEVIPRAQFSIPIQATIGGNIIARSDVKAFRKDVIQKLYGGDRTRKDKLLDKQKKGKKKMKMVGRVEIPQEAFLKVFSRN